VAGSGPHLRERPLGLDNDDVQAQKSRGFGTSCTCTFISPPVCREWGARVQQQNLAPRHSRASGNARSSKPPGAWSKCVA